MSLGKKKIFHQSAAFETDYSLTDSFGDGSGLAYWVNPNTNNSQGTGYYYLSEDVGSLSTYTFSQGGAIAYHAGNDEVSVHTDASLTTDAHIKTHQSYTVSSWIRINAATPLNRAHFYWQAHGGSNSTQNSYCSLRDLGSSTWRLEANHFGGSTSYVYFDFNPSSYTAYTSYYRHFGFVFDSNASTYNFYINGSSVANGTLSPSNTINSTSRMNIMGTSYNGGARSQYACYMGDIRWYQRALTSAEFLAMAQYDGLP